MRVRSRRVYYLCGFDPRGAAFYHELYKSEAVKQQNVDGCTYLVGPTQSNSSMEEVWEILAQSDAETTRTTYSFLKWDDILRAHWTTSAWGVLRRTVRFTVGYAASGGLCGTWKVSKRFFWTLLTPVLSLLLAVLASLLVSTLFVWGVSWLTDSSIFTWLAGAGTGGLVLLGCWRLSRKLRLPWLACAFDFLLRWGRDGDESLDRRFSELANHVAIQILDDPTDEVLVIGHCSGSLAAICFMAQLQEILSRQAAAGAAPRNVKLLTFAQVIPMFALMKRAAWFRQRLQAVVDANLAWLDYSSPADPLCYALVDPLASCAMSSAGITSGYRVRSSRFDLMFGEAEYAALRQDPFRIHFQYLCSSQRSTANSFFKLTAGHDPLERNIFSDR